MSHQQNPFLDKLAELVGQERAPAAIALADRAREHTASLIREATDEARARVTELEAAVDEATEALARRAHEIAVLNTIIDDLKKPVAAKPAAK